MTEPRDYVELGTNRLPDGTRKRKTLAYLGVYLEELTDSERVALVLIDSLLAWDVVPPQYNFILERLGQILGQPRPSGFGLVDYQHVLIARAIARASDSTTYWVTKLVQYLATLNGGLGQFIVKGSPPEHWKIVFFEVDLSPAWLAVYTDLIYAAIGATDSFELSFANGSTALYDESLYDVTLYA